MVSFLPIYEMYKNTYAGLSGFFSPENRFRVLRQGILSKKRAKPGSDRVFCAGTFCVKKYARRE